MNKLFTILSVLLLIVIVPRGLFAEHAEEHGMKHDEQAAEHEEHNFELPFEKRSDDVVILKEKQQLMGINTVSAKVQKLYDIIRTVGRVEFDETKLATVNLKFEGWVENLYADYEGKYVKKGEVLADIYSPEFYSMQLEFVNLLQWKDEKGHRFQRNVEFNWGDRYGTTGHMLTFDIESMLQVARERMELWEVPQKTISKIEKGQKPQKLYRLVSPANGYIIAKKALKGTKVAAGETLFDIADLSTVWVIADIYEYELHALSEGQDALIKLSYLPDKMFPAKVDYIYPTVSDTTRTVKVRFVVKNPQTELKPGMYTRVELGIDEGEGLVVPEDAIIDTGTRKVVYVKKGEGRFSPREVRTGKEAEGMVEIREGLETGEEVVVTAAFIIDSETRLQQTGKRSCCAP